MTPQQLIILLIPLIIWDLIWKGIALWRSAKNNELYWFIALLVVNSAGILPIIYIYFVDNKKKSNKRKK